MQTAFTHTHTYNQTQEFALALCPPGVTKAISGWSSRLVVIKMSARVLTFTSFPSYVDEENRFILNNLTHSLQRQKRNDT